MLILSIMFSPLLRRIFSHRSVIYLGSISFPLYLLHGTWIRLFLTWALYQFLPQFSFLGVIEYRPNEDEDVRVYLACNSIICKLVVAVVFCIWMASLLAFAKFWKDYVDILGLHSSRWAEDVVLGKKVVLDLESFPAVRNEWHSSQKTAFTRDTEKLS
jgi:hypothetical protein